jgi:replication fork protection complex subunit Csm3/Swi3
MARGDPSVGSHPSETDALDEIFDYDANIDDILDAVNDRDSNTNPHRHTAGLEDSTSSRADQALGIDEEIKVTKARKPIAKLDETRQVSRPGCDNPGS